jgi:putative transposase
MCLRLVFLLITRIAAWLLLSRREEAWKTAKILLPRHQLAVLQRRQPCRPKLNWADRALIATLLSVIPTARRHGLRAGLRVKVAAPIVCEILNTSGIDPARRQTCQDRAGLVSVPALSARRDPGERLFAAGLLDGTQAYLLAATEHASRRIRILKVTQHPTGSGPPSRPATFSWTSANRRTGSSP